MKKIRTGLIVIAIISIIGLIGILNSNNWILSKNIFGIYLLIIANVCTFTSGILHIIINSKKNKI